jgi:hypothetical protein
MEGIVQNGVVVLGPGITLPEGTHVLVEPIPTVSSNAGPVTQQDGEGYLKWLLDLAGTANDLPTDMARNHDHYLHGAPKK